MCIGGDLPYFYGANGVLIACIDHTSSPMQGVLIVSIGWEGAQSGRWSGRTARGEGAGWEGEKVKRQLSLRHVGIIVVSQRMWKVPVVQSGRALPMGRCASPPWGKAYMIEICTSAPYIDNHCDDT